MVRYAPCIKVGKIKASYCFSRMRQTRTIGFLALLATTGLLGFTATAGATTATATLAAGSLAFVSAPPSVAFSSTLTGLDQTSNTNQPLDVSDATGSGAGWNLTATSTTFTSGSHTMANNATTIGASPAQACDAGASCVLATNSVSYPYSLPAGATAPTATKLYNAATNTGQGDQTITPTWSLVFGAYAFAGSYTSTWTISLVSGP